MEATLHGGSERNHQRVDHREPWPWRPGRAEVWICLIICFFRGKPKPLEDVSSVYFSFCILLICLWKGRVLFPYRAEQTPSKLKKKVNHGPSTDCLVCWSYVLIICDPGLLLLTLPYAVFVSYNKCICSTLQQCSQTTSHKHGRIEGVAPPKVPYPWFKKTLSRKNVPYSGI